MSSGVTVFESGRRVARGLGWRLASTVRVLPDFLVLGAQKAGTTSVYDSLCQLPGMLPARKKEVRFFDRYWDRGVHWYRWNFPERWMMRDRNTHQVTGEATPEYLVDPRVPRRVAETLPSCKLIVLLRHPVDRALSQYKMNIALGVESRSFRDAIDADAAGLEDGRSTDWHTQLGFHSYVERSRYAPQLRRWLAEFPRESFHVTTLESMLADPGDEMNRIASFLDLEVGNRSLGFASSNRRNYDKLDPRERSELFKLFEHDVEESSHILGWDLPYRA